MTLKTSIGTAVVSGIVALACVGPAAAAYGDAHDRSTAPTAGQAAGPTAYPDAVDRALRAVGNSGTSTDRGTYLDGHDRGTLPAGSAVVPATSSESSEFSWNAAFVGAGMTLFVGGLLFIVVALVRRERHPLALP
jgi:hypothetical protein